MARKEIAIVAGCFAAWVLVPASVNAFEQQAPSELAQPSPSGMPAEKAQPGVKSLSSDVKGSDPSSKESKKGFKIPGFGNLAVPKMNFGLDLMYGNQPKDDSALEFTNDPLIEKNDMTIMGKVKRRF